MLGLLFGVLFALLPLRAFSEEKEEKEICWGQYDVMFVLDASASIEEMEFLEIKVFVNDLTSKLHISSTYVHVGIIQFACPETLVYSMSLGDDQGDDEEYVEAFTDPANSWSGLQQAKGFCTFLNTGLKLAFDKLWLDEDRLQEPKMVVFLTDGATSNMPDDITQAEALKDKGAVLFGIGVGLKREGTAERHIQSLVSTSRPDEEGRPTNKTYYYRVENFDALLDITNDIAEHFPCSSSPFMQFLIWFPIALGIFCCLCCTIVLISGLALVCVKKLADKDNGKGVAGLAANADAGTSPGLLHEGLTEPVPEVPARADASMSMAKKGGMPVKKSMYYIAGAQTAVNWGEAGMGWDTPYRPGDMGMGERFGHEKGATYGKLEDEGEDQPVAVAAAPVEGGDEVEGGLLATIPPKPKFKKAPKAASGKKKKKSWCFIL